MGLPFSTRLMTVRPVRNLESVSDFAKLVFQGGWLVPADSGADEDDDEDDGPNLQTVMAQRGRNRCWRAVSPGSRFCFRHGCRSRAVTGCWSR